MSFNRIRKPQNMSFKGIGKSQNLSFKGIRVKKYIFASDYTIKQPPMNL